MTKYALSNRKMQKIVVALDLTQNAKGLVVIMHGLGGNKDQPQIMTFAEAFKEKEFTVVRFDTTNTFGESEGKFEDATTTNYLEDLEDVIKWIKKQDWYQEPFYLVGHSLGGISIATYAENHPQEIKGLAPLSTVVSGLLRTQTNHHQLVKDQWQATGWLEEQSSLSSNGKRRLPWSHIQDSLHHDLLPKASSLTMPVLMVVGENDILTPYEQEKILFDLLPGKKEMHVIKGAEHTFRTPEQLTEVKRIILHWIDSLEVK